MQNILLWGNAHIFFKNFNKVADVVEAAVESNLRDRRIGRGELLSCTFDPVIIQIVDRCALGDLPEKAAKIFRVHSGKRGERLKRDFLRIVLLDVAQDLF